MSGFDFKKMLQNIPGEMGRRIAAKDWSATPLGSPERWPSTLKNAVTMIVAAPCPMALYWGKELILIYNDAYEPLLGEIPEPLGRALSDIRVNIWVPPRETVAGEARLFRDIPFAIFRQGLRKQVLFDCFTSPLHNDSGDVAGILSTFVEKTDERHCETGEAGHEGIPAAVLEALPMGVFLTMVPSGAIYDMNEAWVSLTGRSRKEEIAGKTLRELDLFPDPEEREHLFEVSRECGYVRNLKIVYRTRNGESRIALVNMDTIRTNGQKFVLWTAADVTGICNQVEEKFRRTAQVLQNINRILQGTIRIEKEEELCELCLDLVIKVTGSEIGFIDEIGRDGYLHDMAISDTGWQQCSIYEKKGHCRVQGNFAIRGLSNRVIERKEGFFTNDPASHPDSVGIPEGHPALNSFLGAPLIREGRVIGMIALANKDGGYAWRDLDDVLALAPSIVESLMRKRAEAALRKSERNLAEAQRIAHIGSWEWDIQTGALHWSTELFHIYGLDPASYKPTIESFLEFVHPEDCEFVGKKVDEIVSGKVPVNFDFRIIRKDGSVRCLNTIGEMVDFDEQGKPLLMRGTNHDITDRKHTEEALREMAAMSHRQAAELECANRELQAFNYSVSHDLRNPLRTINGFSRILLEEHGGSLDGEGHDCLVRIVNGVKKMQRIIDDMLSLSRVGRQELTQEDVDLSAMARDCLRELGEADPGRTVEVVVRENLHANADPRLIALALENLLRNAWKFTSRKEGARIEFGMTERDGCTVYFVADNGAGFDMQFADAVFEPFKRLHTEKEFGGTGVGLSIVQRIITRHGGTVWAEGEPGKGATFYFTLGRKNER